MPLSSTTYQSIATADLSGSITDTQFRWEKPPLFGRRLEEILNSRAMEEIILLRRETKGGLVGSKTRMHVFLKVISKIQKLV